MGLTGGMVFKSHMESELGKTESEGMKGIAFVMQNVGVELVDGESNVVDLIARETCEKLWQHYQTNNGTREMLMNED